MTGQLVLGRLGLPDLIVEIEGSGIVTGVVQTVVLPPPSPRGIATPTGQIIDSLFPNRPQSCSC